MPTQKQRTAREGSAGTLPANDRSLGVKSKSAVSRMSLLLKRLRQDRGISQLQLANEARVNPSVVNRAERGADAKLSTWEKLFGGLG